jgi:hypothetical protein
MRHWPSGVSDGLSIPCSVCGEIPPFDWRGRHETWDAVIPKPFRRGVVCLPCFAGLAREAGVRIDEALEEVQFVGPGYTIGMRPYFVVEHATAQMTTLASGIEAPSGGETGTGSTEGESPVGEAETPNLSNPSPVSRR